MQISSQKAWKTGGGHWLSVQCSWKVTVLNPRGSVEKCHKDAHSVFRDTALKDILSIQGAVFPRFPEDFSEFQPSDYLNPKA